MSDSRGIDACLSVFSVRCLIARPTRDLLTFAVKCADPNACESFARYLAKRVLWTEKTVMDIMISYRMIK